MIAAAADALASAGYCVIDDFLDAASLSDWQAYATTQADLLRPARVGRGTARTLDTRVRSDSIRWLDPAEADLVGVLCRRFERWRQVLNERLFLGLVELELHIARYQPGGFYARHLDRFRDDDARVVSAVLYLNDRNWRAADGGALALEVGGDAGSIELAPCGGRLVLFRSERFWHAVRPAFRERWSVTGWFRRRPAGGL